MQPTKHLTYPPLESDHLGEEQMQLPSGSVMNFVRNREITGRTRGITAKVSNLISSITADYDIMQSIDKWSKVVFDLSSIDGLAILDNDNCNDPIDSYELVYDERESESNTLGRVEESISEDERKSGEKQLKVIVKEEVTDPPPPMMIRVKVEEAYDQCAYDPKKVKREEDNYHDTGYTVCKKIKREEDSYY